MKKILHIPNYYHPHIGGIEQTARDIVNSLDSSFTEEVICFRGEKGDSIEEIDGIKVIKCGEFKKVASQSLSLSYKKLLKKEMKEYNPDIIVFHYPNPFLAHYLVKYLKKNPNIIFILWWHMDITKQKRLAKLFEKQSQYLLKRANKIVCTSPKYIEGSKYLTANIAKVTPIPSCIPDYRADYSGDITIRAEEIRKENEGKKIIFSFGRHVEYKGLKYLVEASKLLPNDYQIFIGGKGPLTEELKRQAEGDNKIKFLGFLDNNELKSYIKACDIFAFPSITKNEGFGLALVEAEAASKPAVTFTVEGSGINYVALDGITAIESPNSDSKALASAIIKLGNDPDLRLSMGNAGYNRYKDNFSFKKFSELVNDLFLEYK